MIVTASSFIDDTCVVTVDVALVSGLETAIVVVGIAQISFAGIKSYINDSLHSLSH